jgi:glycosyltransferase involved in cell wall biosynthesis
VPKVTVGIPVFNGERFIERAMRCFLDQDFDDIELIVADNASTDNTLEICREIASVDSRIQTLTSDCNMGAAPNFNRLVDAARGEYFKWAAHDDWCSSDFLSTMLSHFASNPHAVLCYAPMAVEDDSGQIYRLHDDILLHLQSDDLRSRYHDILYNLHDPTPLIFGLIRADVLRRTGRIPNAPEPDRLLLNELVLYGHLLRVPGPTFVHYGPPAHMQHYGGDDTPLGRRSWVWLHAENIARPKWATYRILRSNLASLNRAPQLTHLGRFLMIGELCLAMSLTRFKSKLRWTSRRLRSRLAKWVFERRIARPSRSGAAPSETNVNCPTTAARRECS